MSVIEIPATCVCGGLIPGLRQCPEHRHIYRDSKRLTAVTRVVRQFFPMPDTIPQDVLENARERGEQLDRLFGAYVLGTLKAIPAGTRMDARDLFFKVKNWYDRQNFKRVQVQVLLGGKKYGGLCDFCFDGLYVDLKGTYNLLPEHEIQVGGYTTIAGEMAGVSAWDENPKGALLHVTERLKEPRLVPVSMQASYDWNALVTCLDVLERLKKL